MTIRPRIKQFVPFFKRDEFYMIYYVYKKEHEKYEKYQ